MKPVQDSRPVRKGLPLIVAGSPFVIALVLLAGTLFLNTWSAHGDHSDSPTSIIVVDQDGRCHLVSPSCSELLSVSTTSFFGEAPSTITPVLALHQITTVEGTAPTEALLLLRAPPPRYA